MLLTLVAVAIAPILAHEEIRVIGTVTKVQASAVGVKMKDGKEVSIRTDKQTDVKQDDKSVEVSKLKQGQSVVIDAFGDGYDDLLALEIRIVPTSAPPAAKKGKE
jgi:hypothetical protein